MSNADMSATKRALAAIESLQRKLDAIEQAQREPIAVVGMACRFPGGADTPEAYWDLLTSGRDAIVEVPPERWDVNAFYNADPAVRGKMYTRRGGFLPAVDQFDAPFFGIAPREAVSIDPQHRLLLELAWEALENANIPADRLYNTNTGVFVGISNPEHSAHLLWSGDPTRINAYAGTGGSLGVAAGRLSYVFGLTGPSLIVDTACSSSLVAIHLACQSLRARECDAALVAGVNLIFGPETFINFCQAGMLAADGHCKTFDASADGYARGEGGGVVVLKRLSDAQRDGDCVLALIHGSAVNQDGPSGGLTVPNGPAQTKVIRRALEAGGIEPSRVGYVEAHGTGTSLGDPIELRALGSAYGVARDPSHPLLVGSVKTNFGHLESAAGIAGLIKVVLMLQHGQIPPHLHLKQPNPHIPWSELPIRVPTVLSAWVGEERIAGVSSFSFSGTNAHVVLASAPLRPLPPVKKSPRQHWRLLPLSARDDVALNALAGAWRERLAKAESEPETWDELCRSAADGRSRLPYRMAVPGDSPSGMLRRLTTENLPRARAASAGVGKIAFLFTGQGSQYHRMGQELYQESDIFRAALDECDALLQARIGKSLIDLIFGEGDSGGQNLHVTAYTQPVLFSIQYALARLWLSWGIRPDAMLGHSVGEYAAACGAGVFSLEDALGLIAERGQLMQRLCDPGAMLSVPMSEEDVLNVIRPWSGELAVATLNGPRNVVVSSNPMAVAALADGLSAAGIEARHLPVSHAFHSPMMAPMLAPFAVEARSIRYQSASAPIYSTLSGKRAGAELSSADYWVRHVESPVRFEDGMRAMLADGYRIFVELGPKPTLCALGREIAQTMGPELADACTWLPSLRSGKSAWATMIESLGHLWVRGANIDWAALNGPGPGHARLPNYPFQRRLYAIDRSVGSTAAMTPGAGEHPFLGARIDSPALDKNTAVFATELYADSAGLLAHHRIFGEVVLPAAGHIEMALAAVAKLSPTNAERADFHIRLQDIVLQQALLLRESSATPVQIVLTDAGARAAFDFTLYSRHDNNAEGPWSSHSAGRAVANADSPAPMAIDLDALRLQCTQVLSVDDYYRRAHAVGIEHGERFRALQALWQGDGLILGQLRLPALVLAGADQFLFHPVLLDAAFQMVGVPLLASGEAYLPVGMDVFHRYRRPSTEIWCVVRPRGQAGQLFSADLDLVDPDGQLLASVVGLRFQRTARHSWQPNAQLGNLDCLYEMRWERRVGWLSDAKWLPAPRVLAGQLQAAMDDALGKVAWYRELFAALDRLVAGYARAALVQLGLKWQSGQLLRLDGLMVQLGIVPERRRLLGRLLAILAEQGQLRIVANGGWAMCDVAPADTRGLAVELSAQFPEASSELALVTRCGVALDRVLAGKVEGLQLLFPEGDMSMVARFYAESPGLLVLNDLLRATLVGAVACLPEACGVRILEIGGGTGSSTGHLLPHLPAARCRYCFTDVSAIFTTSARERYAGIPFVDCQVLDIENDPIAQGFDAASFDIVVAANVLHATRDVGKSLEHINRLLAPGGILLLLEGTSRQPWLDMTFGLTEGWWRFSDELRRPDYPLLEASQWDKVLGENGFDAMEVISPDRSAGQAVCRQAVMVATKRLTPPAGEWLVLPDRGGIGEELASLIGQSSASCGLITEEQAATPELLRRRIGECKDLRGIVHARGLDAVSTDALDPVGMQAAQELGCRSLLELLRVLGETQLQSPPHLLVVSRGAVGGLVHENPGKPASMNIAQAPLWAMGRVVASEHPELLCTQVDLDPDDADVSRCAGALWQEAMFRSGESVLRRSATLGTGPSRQVARLRRMAPLAASPPAPLQVRADSMHVITGGWGDLGLASARWLVEQKGARLLMLAGRGEPGIKAREQILAMEALGATIHCMQVDVTDARQVDAMIEMAAQSAQLGGVIHAAGALDDGLLASMSWPRFAAVLAPKTLGAWNMHHACRGRALDFFVLYSSAAAVLGPAGQASYAAANAFLDALAAYRSTLGLAAMAINWGAWSEIGMVARTPTDNQLESRGMRRISPAQALEILGHLFDHPVGQAVVAPIDWDRLLAQYGNHPLFEWFSAAAASRSKTNPKIDLHDRLAGLPPVERRAVIMDVVKSVVARILGLESAQVVDEEGGFFEIGMDSLTAVEFRNALQVVVGANLPTTLLFKYSTVQALVCFLNDELLAVDRGDGEASDIAPTAAMTAIPAAHKSPDAEEVAGMSDEELSAMIEAEMRDL